MHNNESNPKAENQKDTTDDLVKMESETLSIQELEARLEALLTAGKMETEQVDQAAMKRISPRTEIRIQTQLDPIVEETRQFRSIAKEVDNRYDSYLKGEIK
ncbi:hypothetical protein [Paenibacillus taiwanensis]|uniref:hypothetical protein n=1 Tax=Paenibacillus taiwanensis TaxID=401638 RepID=UPI00041D6E84